MKKQIQDEIFLDRKESWTAHVKMVNGEYHYIVESKVYYNFQFPAVITDLAAVSLVLDRARSMPNCPLAAETFIKDNFMSTQTEYTLENGFDMNELEKKGNLL